MKTLTAPAPVNPLEALFSAPVALDMGGAVVVYVVAVLALAAAARFFATL